MRDFAALYAAEVRGDPTGSRRPAARGVRPLAAGAPAGGGGDERRLRYWLRRLDGGRSWTAARTGRAPASSAAAATR